MLSKLWKISIVPKHVYLAWRFLNDCLPVKEKLIQKRVLPDPICPRCKSELEDLDRIFMNCWYAKQAWLLSHLEIWFEGIPMSFIDWLENTISKASCDVIVYILLL